MAIVKMVPTTWTETNRALHIIKTRRVTEEICPLKSFQVLGEGAGFKIPISRSYPLSLHSLQIPLNHIPVGGRQIFPAGMRENNNGSVCFKDYCRGLQNRIQSNSSINFSDNLHFATRESFESPSINRGNKFPSRKGGYYIEELGTSLDLSDAYLHLYMFQYTKTAGDF